MGAYRQYVEMKKGIPRDVFLTLRFSKLQRTPCWP